MRCAAIAITSLLLMALMLLTSCSNEHPVEVDDFPSLFDSSYSSAILADPATYYPGSTTNITFSAMPAVAGKGHMTIQGRGSGSIIGNASHPVSGPVGLLTFPVTFVPGDIASITWHLTMTSPRSAVSVSCFAAYDSVIVGESMVAVSSPAFHSVYPDIIGIAVVRSISLTREAK